jgi:plastocyanin
MLSRVFGLAAWAVLAAVPLDAGTVSGTVKVAGAAEADKTVVYIDVVPKPTGEPTPARVSQRGARFTPALLPVMKGTAVDFTNDDWLAHSAFSKSAAKPFDLGIYGKGERRSVTFEKPGVVEIFCAIHPRMNGVILVLQNPYFAKPSANGAYSLGEVPPGAYDLKVYRMGGQVSRRKVMVPPTGGVVVDF